MKNATIWRTRSGEGEVSNDNTGFGLLTEAGESLLTEASELIMLENTLVYPVDDTVWIQEGKNISSWRVDSGRGETNTNGLGVERVTQSGATRVTQSGETRVLQDGGVDYPAQTVWEENNG